MPIRISLIEMRKFEVGGGVCMNIKKAKTENFEDVKLITHETIKEIYPHYYPRGVVDFFLEHHNSENIIKDILADIVYLIMDGEETLGTVGKYSCQNVAFRSIYNHKIFAKRFFD